MATIQVFDPALCCSTGVCGVEIDQALVTFAADVDWLKSCGVQVARVNLAQQPQAFADHAQVRQLLQTQGVRALPTILVDEELQSSGRYPSRDELARWAGLDSAPSPLARQRGAAVAIPVVAAAPSNANACCAPAPAAAATESKCC